MSSRVVAALLCVQLLFAVHYVVAKWVLSIVPAPAWVVIRVCGGALVLGALALLVRAPFPRQPRTLAAIAGLSLFGVLLNQVLFNEGLARTLPSHAALINCSIPVTTLLIAVLLRRESLSWRKAAALSLTLGGVLWLLLEQGIDFGNQTLVGDLLCLANATAFSIFLALSGPVLRANDARSTTALLFAFGSIGVLLYGGDEWASLPAQIWQPGLWLATAFVVLGPTAASYFLNSWALARVEASSVALFIYVQFVIAAPLSAIVLQERLSSRLLPAALAVFAGLWLASRRRNWNWRARRRVWLTRAGALLALLLLAAWASIRPSHERDWSPEFARLPALRFDADRVTIENLRDFRWRSLQDFDLRYRTREFDLSRVESLWFCLSIFDPQGWRGPAHSLLSFGFDDGSYLAVSVEARKERGESYSIQKGLRKRFELMYVLGEESDLIANRAALRPDSVLLYPIAAEPAAIRAILRDLLLAAERLRTRPEWYNTINNNCTSRLREHVDAALPGAIPPTWKLLFPGYADELLQRLGYIEGDLEAARRRWEIKARATAALGSADFSAAIRTQGANEDGRP